MKKIEIMWRKPEYVELVNALADEIMGQVLPEARALLANRD